MAFGALQRGKSYRQLWRRSATRTPPAGRGAASLVLGSDATDEVAVLQAGDRIEVQTSGDVNDAKRLEARGVLRLNASPPEGYGWQASLQVDTWTSTIVVGETLYGDLAFPLEIPINDLAENIAGLGAGIDISFALELILDPDNPGAPATDVEVVLPSFYVDQLLAPEVVSSDLYVHTRNPSPGQTDVPPDQPTISFTLADVSGAGVDLANTTVTIDGQIAYSGGVFVAPWAGTVTPGSGPTGNDVVFSLTIPATKLPFESEQEVEINVISQLLGPASPIDETWIFIAADITPPAVQTAVMLDKKTIRVTFTDGLLLDASAAGALNPANYSVTRVSAPAVSLQVVSVTAVPGRSNAVDVGLDIEASQGAIYTLLAKDIKDDSNNVLDPQGRERRFTGFVPPKPIGRRFELLDFFPDFNIADDRTVDQGGDPVDPGSGDLRRFLLVLQDVVDLLLCSVDEWTQIIDIDLAPEQFLDAILQDLGNPFADCISDLSVNDKRRLARILISIYKQKGTEPGIINAVRFFTGIEITLDIINCRQFWQLDISLLGIGTILAPPVGSPLWYSFFIVSPVVLTDEQRSRILCIADYMKAAHEHILGIIEPGGEITPSDYWILNVSLLGATSPPATVLA